MSFTAGGKKDEVGSSRKKGKQKKARTRSTEEEEGEEVPTHVFSMIMNKRGRREARDMVSS